MAKKGQEKLWLLCAQFAKAKITLRKKTKSISRKNWFSRSIAKRAARSQNIKKQVS